MARAWSRSASTSSGLRVDRVASSWRAASSARPVTASIAVGRGGRGRGGRRRPAGPRARLRCGEWSASASSRVCCRRAWRASDTMAATSETACSGSTSNDRQASRRAARAAAKAGSASSNELPVEQLGGLDVLLGVGHLGGVALDLGPGGEGGLGVDVAGQLGPGHRRHLVLQLGDPERLEGVGLEEDVDAAHLERQPADEAGPVEDGVLVLLGLGQAPLGRHGQRLDTGGVDLPLALPRRSGGRPRSRPRGRRAGRRRRGPSTARSTRVRAAVTRSARSHRSAWRWRARVRTQGADGAGRSEAAPASRRATSSDRRRAAARNSACSRSRSAGASAGSPSARSRARWSRRRRSPKADQGLVEGGGGGPVFGGQPDGRHGRLGHQQLGRFGAPEEGQLGFEPGDGAGGVVVAVAGGPLVAQADLVVEPGDVGPQPFERGGGGRRPAGTPPRPGPAPPGPRPARRRREGRRGRRGGWCPARSGRRRAAAVRRSRVRRAGASSAPPPSVRASARDSARSSPLSRSVTVVPPRASRTRWTRLPDPSTNTRLTPKPAASPVREATARSAKRRRRSASSPPSTVRVRWKGMVTACPPSR